MTTKRLMLIIAVVTFLALITAWQQVQTTRWSYRISEVTELKNQLKEEQKALEIQLTHVESPEQLLTLARLKEVNLVYPEKLSVVNIFKQAKKTKKDHQPHLAQGQE